jgi:hypothetical protein
MKIPKEFKDLEKVRKIGDKWGYDRVILYLQYAWAKMLVQECYMDKTTAAKTALMDKNDILDFVKSRCLLIEDFDPKELKITPTQEKILRAKDFKVGDSILFCLDEEGEFLDKWEEAIITSKSMYGGHFCISLDHPMVKALNLNYYLLYRKIKPNRR